MVILVSTLTLTLTVTLTLSLILTPIGPFDALRDPRRETHPNPILYPDPKNVIRQSALTLDLSYPLALIRTLPLTRTLNLTLPS